MGGLADKKTDKWADGWTAGWQADVEVDIQMVNGSTKIGYHLQLIFSLQPLLPDIVIMPYERMVQFELSLAGEIFWLLY